VLPTVSMSSFTTVAYRCSSSAATSAFAAATAGASAAAMYIKHPSVGSARKYCYVYILYTGIHTQILY